MSNGFEESKKHYKHLSLFWTDLIHLMSNKPQALTSIGPMRSFAENAKKITSEMVEANENLVEFNNALAKYYKQLADTWIMAQKKVNQKISKIPNDAERVEAGKRIWIDIFDNDFTELFDSKSFGENYGKLVSKELELTKHWNNIMNVMIKTANLPTKQEMDELYKEIHMLRRRLSKIEGEIRFQKKNRRKRFNRHNRHNNINQNKDTNSKRQQEHAQ